MTMFNAGKLAVIIAAGASLGACATTAGLQAGAMLPGRIVSISDGMIMPMQIELSPMSHPTGKISASNPRYGGDS